MSAARAKGKAVAKVGKKAVAARAGSRAPRIPFREYPLKPQEKQAADAWLTRARAREQIPEIKCEKQPDGAFDVYLDHPAEGVGQMLFTNAIGGTSQSFAMEIMTQVVNASCTDGAPDTKVANFMASAIQGIGPKNEAESMLAAQMAATHVLAMQAAARMHDRARTGMITQYDSALNAMTKLTRTFALQLDALKRFRSTGEQKVTVQHVHINGDGTQAVVSNGAPAVTQGGGA